MNVLFETTDLKQIYPVLFFFFQVENESNRLEKIVAEMIVRKKSKLAQIYQRSHLESPFAGQGNNVLTYF